MHNLTHTEAITESLATDLIFNACRANEDRSDWQNGDGYSVTFKLFINGREWEATLRDAAGTVVAIATVDKFDC